MPTPCSPSSSTSADCSSTTPRSSAPSGWSTGRPGCFASSGADRDNGVVEIAFLLVAIAVTVLTVTAVAGRLGVAPPIPLILVGWAGSYLPGVPTIHLESEVVLLGLLP